MLQLAKVEEIAHKATLDCTRNDANKLSNTDFTMFRTELVKHNDYITNKIDDTFNRMIETEIYLDKY